MTMNKILLLLIAASGFLLIFYANTDLFRRKSSKQVLEKPTPVSSFQNDAAHTVEENHHHDAEHHRNHTQLVEIKRVKYIPRINQTEYNIFVIYTKQNYVLKSKFELFVRSLLKYTSVQLHLHIISDSKSEAFAEETLKKEINQYKRIVFYTLYDVDDCARKISDISHSMMPFFSSHPGSYYSDALFYLSLGLHRVVDENMRRAIMIDCDVVFRTDVKRLFDEFEK